MSYLDFAGKDFYATAKQLLLDNGKRLELSKGDFLCHMGEKLVRVGILTSGALKYSCLASNGHERIISFAFTGDLVGSYSALRNNQGSLFEIIALESSTIYMLPLQELDAAIGCEQRMAMSETLSYRLLQGMIDNCCLSAHERYEALANRFPDIHNRMTNRTIASYLGITPESLCRLRKRLLDI